VQELHSEGVPGVGEVLRKLLSYFVGARAESKFEVVKLTTFRVR